MKFTWKLQSRFYFLRYVDIVTRPIVSVPTYKQHVSYQPNRRHHKDKSTYRRKVAELAQLPLKRRRIVTAAVWARHHRRSAIQGLKLVGIDTTNRKGEE
jgi:hypothetical protein